MGIPEGKHRYNVTLTPANVERFRRLCKDLGLPISTMSAAIDDLLRKMGDMFQTAKDQGKLSMSDLIMLMGKQIEEIENEVKKNDENNSEEKKFCPDCGLPWHKFHNCELNPIAKPKPDKKRNPATRKR